jgi:hypothetical protein
LQLTGSQSRRCSHQSAANAPQQIPTSRR